MPQKQSSSKKSQSKFTPEGFGNALTEFIVEDNLVCILFEYFYRTFTKYILASQYCKIFPVIWDFSDVQKRAWEQRYFLQRHYLDTYYGNFIGASGWII